MTPITDAVSVVYTGFDETFDAARVGAALATKMGVPLRIVHFRTVPRPLDIHRPDGLSPVETEAFATRLVDVGISARVRVYLCRDEIETIPLAFKPHSIVVIGGHHSWLPTRIERMRHALEDAGHFVFVVDPAGLKEHVHACSLLHRHRRHRLYRALGHYQSMRASVAMLDYIVSAVVSVLLLIYLGWAMFQPEKF